MNKEHATVAIIEDDPAVLDYLRVTIRQAGFLTLVGEATCCADAVPLVEELKPRVLLVDLGLPDGSGLELIRKFRGTCPDTQCLVITGFNDETHVFSALKAGARGYLYKHESDQEIGRSIQQLLDGGAPVSPIIARLLLRRFEQPDQSDDTETLTEREITVLNLVSRGFTSKEVAEKLELSYHTVTTHIKNIYRKLEVNSRTEALFEASQQGLLDSPQR